MIEVRNLTKRYGEKIAVNNISFSVNEGEVLGFLGPNGAGKSTTMNMLTGYISSSSGQAMINGIDILDDPSAAKAQIGYLPEFPPLYPDMTIKEYLNFVYDLKKCKLPRNEHIQQICALVKITDVYGRVIKHLSKGYKQRVGLAQAMIGNPPVLILDEPTAGLDPKQIIEIRALIKRLGQRHTVILSSHILPEIQATCDRVIIINKGAVVANDTMENLSQNVSDERRIIVRVDGPANEVAKQIKAIKGVVEVDVGPEAMPGICDYTVDLTEAAAQQGGLEVRRNLFKRMAEKNWPIVGLRSTEMTLEDIFLKITMGDITKDTTTDPDASENPEASAKKAEILHAIKSKPLKEQVIYEESPEPDEVWSIADNTDDTDDTGDKDQKDATDSENGGDK